MTERVRDPVWWLELACAVLALLVAIHLAGLVFGSGSASGVQALDGGAVGAAAGAGGEAGANELPHAFGPIAERQLFGAAAPPTAHPVVLEGIAHDWVFLRSPRGRAGLVRVGESLDGVKVLELGWNRVVVEVEGERKELVMHQGLGGGAPRPPEPGRAESAENPPPPPAPPEGDGGKP
ncbi:MAG: hypothetical protein JXQ29_08540 [Planctomycetes bacterium]|nr:hypothetical protein [Planctomycetota bacterium]